MSQQLTQLKMSDEYVLVRKDQKDVKESVASVPVSLPKQIAAGVSVKALLKGAKRSGANTMQLNAKLAQASFFTSGANATQFPVVTITASSFQDFTYYQNVYDEYRVREIVCHACVQPSASPTTLGRAWSLAFDPGNSGAYGSIYDTLCAQKAIGPVAIPSVILSDTTKTGFQILKSGKLLPLFNAGGGVVTPVVGGSWCSTSDNSCIHGYIKGAVDAIGAALTTTIAVWTVLHCEFRMRT